MRFSPAPSARFSQKALVGSGAFAFASGAPGATGCSTSRRAGFVVAIGTSAVPAPPEESEDDDEAEGEIQ